MRELGGSMSPIWPNYLKDCHFLIVSKLPYLYKLLMQFYFKFKTSNKNRCRIFWFYFTVCNWYVKPPPGLCCLYAVPLNTDKSKLKRLPSTGSAKQNVSCNLSSNMKISYDGATWPLSFTDLSGVYKNLFQGFIYNYESPWVWVVISLGWHSETQSTPNICERSQCCVWTGTVRSYRMVTTAQ